MAIQLGKRRRFVGTFTGDDGLPAAIDETNDEIKAATTNGAIEEFEKVMNADGAVVGAKGAVRPSQIGPVEVQVTADADRGDGVRTLTLIGTETCIGGEATGGTFGFEGTDEP